MRVVTQKIDVSLLAAGGLHNCLALRLVFFFFQAEDGIRYSSVTGVQTCALPIYFEAFVTSSCSTIATDWVASGDNNTSGPSTLALPFPAQGASSLRTRSARLTPCQWLRLSNL